LASSISTNIIKKPLTNTQGLSSENQSTNNRIKSSSSVIHGVAFYLPSFYPTSTFLILSFFIEKNM